jgi:hypothetical protein
MTYFLLCIRNDDVSYLEDYDLREFDTLAAAGLLMMHTADHLTTVTVVWPRGPQWLLPIAFLIALRPAPRC